MTPDAFIARWSGATLSERAAAQSHFIDLCRLLGEPTPAEADPHGEFYCFERGATKATGGKGWTDVWKRGFFGWEYKGKRRDLDAEDVAHFVLRLARRHRGGRSPRRPARPQPRARRRRAGIAETTRRVGWTFRSATRHAGRHLTRPRGRVFTAARRPPGPSRRGVPWRSGGRSATDAAVRHPTGVNDRLLQYMKLRNREFAPA